MSNEELEKQIQEQGAQLDHLRQQLQQEIASRRGLEKTLEERTTQLWMQYQNLPLIALIWEKQGKDLILSDYNKMAGTLTQGKLKNFLGKTAEEFYQPYPEILADLTECWQKKSIFKREVFYQFPTDSVNQYLAIHYVFIPPKSVIFYGENLNEHQKASQELATRFHQQSILSHLSQQGLAATTSGKLMQEAVRLIAQVLNTQYCSLWELLPNGHTLLLREGAGWKKHLIGHITISTETGTLSHNTLISDSPIQIQDLRIETRFSAPLFFHNHKIISGVSLKIPGEKHPFGILAVYTTEERTFSENDINFLSAIANLIAITREREEANAELDLMKRAIDASPNGIVITDATLDNIIIYVNSGFERLTGYQSQEVLGRNCRFLQGAETQQDALRELKQALEEGKECQALLKNYRKDGSLFWNELRIAPVHNQEGYLTHFIGIQTDLTHHQKIQTALIKERTHLAEAQKIAHVGSWEINVITEELTCSEEMLRILGRQETDPAPSLHEYEQQIHPEDRHLWQVNFNRMVYQGKSCELEVRIIQPLGLVRHVLLKGQPLIIGTHNDYPSLPVRHLFGTLLDITERVRFETDLMQSKQFIERITDTSPQVLYIYDLLAESSIYINRQIIEILGYPATDLFTTNSQFFQNIIHPDDRQRISEHHQNFETAEDGEVRELEYRLQHHNGSWRWLRSRDVIFARNPNGSPRQILGTAVDITEHKQALEALRESEERFRTVANFTYDWEYWIGCEGQLIFMSPSCQRITGYAVDTFLQNSQLLETIVHPAERSLVARRLQEEWRQQKPDSMDFRIIHRQGEIRWIAHSSQPVYSSEGNWLGQRVSNRDITERKQAEEQLQYSAFYDSLTGLPNRALFMDRLTSCIRRSQQRRNYLFAVLCCDIDRFKVINESLGHSVGDRLLIAVASRLSICLRPSDTLARLGGDEFTILLDEIQDIGDATQVAEQVRSELMLPFTVGGHRVVASASIGIALSSGYDRPEHLLRDADIAMYRAKESGKARYEIFDQAMHIHALERLHLETDLRRAIEQQEFLVYYQPIVSLKTGKITGFEALIRWQHPEKGLVSPIHFIPIAEETGLIIPIGEWVLRQACDQLRSWHSEFPTDFRWQMSVNLSGRQLSEPELLQHIDQILADSQVDGSFIKLEITESVLMDNYEIAKKILLEIRARDMQLSLDDFGTGYSSLNYLHHFPVNTIKIDRSFVNLIETEEQSQIVHAIVMIAHTLQMDVIAEGIETENQITALQLLGCEYGQGYFFSPPLDAASIEALIRRKPSGFTW